MANSSCAVGAIDVLDAIDAIDTARCDECDVVPDIHNSTLVLFAVALFAFPVLSPFDCSVCSFFPS